MPFSCSASYYPSGSEVTPITCGLFVRDGQMLVYIYGDERGAIHVRVIGTAGHKVVLPYTTLHPECICRHTGLCYVAATAL